MDNERFILAGGYSSGRRTAEAKVKLTRLLVRHNFYINNFFVIHTHPVVREVYKERKYFGDWLWREFCFNRL